MESIYKSIADDIEKDIFEGRYKSGQKMPSVRTIADWYGCTNTTAAKAYGELMSKHLVYSKSKSGYYPVEGLFQQPAPQGNEINFKTGNVMLGKMNIVDLKHCLDHAVDRYANYSMSNNRGGVDSLRQLLVSYLAQSQIFTEAENIFINLGIQQALSILTMMPFPNGGRRILIEEPTYSYYINYLKYIKADFIGIRRDQAGIDLKALETMFKRGDIKFFYTVPRNHNPLGTTYTKRQRQAIVRLAVKYDVYIVEDDYFAEVNSDMGYDPLYTLGDKAHVIHLRSYSKVIPWMRLGMIIMPKPLIPVFKEHILISYHFSYFSASLISQATLEIYIRSHILEKHAATMLKELQEKQHLLLKMLQTLSPYGVGVMSQMEGLYTYITLPERIRENFLIEDLNKEGVLVESGRRFFMSDGDYVRGIRLSVADVNPEQISSGIHIFRRCLERY